MTRTLYRTNILGFLPGLPANRFFRRPFSNAVFQQRTHLQVLLPAAALKRLFCNRVKAFNWNVAC